MAAAKNLIFDLGNVLYDIDFKKMNEGFTSIGIKNIESHFTLNQSHPLFLDLEMGFVNEQAFFDGFRALSNLPLSNDQITIAWNSLLVGFRKSSIQWLKENNKTYPTLLSFDIHLSILYNLFFNMLNKTAFHYYLIPY